MLGIELILAGSTVALVSFYSYASSPAPSGIILLISIWAVAATEIITLIGVYVYMKATGFDLDVSKLTKLKW